MENIVEENEEEFKQKIKSMEQFVVIGLGRFGKSVATTLAKLGKEVLAIDPNEKSVNKLDGVVSGAVVADATGDGVLHSLGVQNFDCAIVCIGNDLQKSILSTYICKQLGVGCVVARAHDEQSKKILELVGADLVIFPEVYMGEKLANILSNPSMNELLNLGDDFKIVEIPLPDDWIDKTIIELDIRKKNKVSIVFVKRDNALISIDAETQLLKGDILIVAGETKPLANLSEMTSEVIDTIHKLKDSI